jgi:hypothetical protein
MAPMKSEPGRVMTLGAIGRCSHQGTRRHHPDDLYRFSERIRTPKAILARLRPSPTPPAAIIRHGV